MCVMSVLLLYNVESKAATNIVGICETSHAPFSPCFQIEKNAKNLLRYDADVFVAFGVNAALVLQCVNGTKCVSCSAPVCITHQLSKQAQKLAIGQLNPTNTHPLTPPNLAHKAC